MKSIEAYNKTQSELNKTLNICAMRAAYFAYKEYKESIKPIQSSKLEVNNDHSD